MKKLILLFVICLCKLIAVAQNKSLFPAKNKFENKSVFNNTIATSYNYSLPPKTTSPCVKQFNRNGIGDSKINFPICESLIGVTDFDLQTNSGSYPRLVKNPDGTICAMWSMYPDGGATNQMGTGYNYFDGSSWGTSLAAPLDSSPSSPSCVVTASYHEESFGHSDSGVIIIERPAKGAGAWSLDASSLKTNGNSNNDTWSRVVPGGINNLSIHCIANDRIQGYDGGNILYSRSTDDGVTWNLLRTAIPGLDSIAYPYYIDGDAYCIATNNDNVAIVIGDLTTDLALFKSTDNGTSWIKTQITNQWTGGSYNPDGNISDINADGIADTVLTTGGDVNVVIDNNGLCHVFWGMMRMCDDNDTLGIKSFKTFPATNGISYWNQNSSTPAVITGAVDWNLNGQIDIATYPTDPNELGFGRYGNMGLSCVPSAACASNNKLYIAYMAINEQADTILYGKSHYQIYSTSSINGGLTWTLPFNLIDAGYNADSTFFEGAYPSIAKFVDNNIYVEYQRDYIPGIFWGSSAGSVDAVANDPLNNLNEIIIIEYPGCVTASIEANLFLFSVSQNNPNPAYGATSININLTKITDAKIEVISLTGQILFADEKINMAIGNHNVNLNTAQFEPGIYFYTVSIGGQKITRKMVVM